MLEHPPIVLASASPRRRALLEDLGLNFEVIPADIDEGSFKASNPKELVALLSLEKARAIASAHQDALIIAADTVVVLDNVIMGKPKNLAENKHYIKQLSGRVHFVYTGHSLLYQGKIEKQVSKTTVVFRDLSDAEIDRFVATHEGLDKAGGYAIQGYGATLVSHLEGDFFNVVGMSIVTVIDCAKRLGVTLV